MIGPRPASIGEMVRPVADEAEIDVEALVAELRAEAEELRARAGPTTLPAPASEARAEDSAGDAAGYRGTTRPLTDAALLATVRTADLLALADPGDVELVSHRGAIGRLVVGAKRFLRRLATPILDRQTGFNRAAVGALGELERVMAAQLTALSRQVLELEARLEVEGTPAAPRDDGFDRRAFEDAFRGSREHLRRAQGRYLEYFSGPSAGPVLDLGCGRAEFLRLLRDAGVPAWGVELDPELVRAARADGLDVRQGDVLPALEGAADASLGGVVAFQVVEHLAFWKIVRLIQTARVKLRPGGRLILETVNIQSLVTWTRAWSLDPTHRQPLHPLTLRFVVEQAGFARVDLMYSGDVEPELRLEEGEGPEARNARRLNALLFAPQDYAVVAST